MEQLPPKPPPIGNPEQAGPKQPAGYKTENDKIEGLISTLVKINKANRRAAYTENQRTEGKEKRNFIMHVIEIVLIAVYAVVTLCEWRTFDNERKTMELESKLANINMLTEHRAWVAPFAIDKYQ